MGIVKFGSARSSEGGGINGIKGDQKGGKEVSIQDYYMHEKGWTCLRAISSADALALAQSMKDACNNDNIGYGQSDRDDVLNEVKKGILIKNISRPCNCDCSSLARACILEAMKIDVGQFNTSSEVNTLLRSGKFMQKVIASEADCKLGDILVTKSQGHTVICVEGFARNESTWPIATVKVVFNAPILSKGCTGKFVKLWQTIIGVDTDGSFGSITDATTRQWQSSHGLVADGSVGERTWNKALN